MSALRPAVRAAGMELQDEIPAGVAISELSAETLVRLGYFTETLFALATMTDDEVPNWVGFDEQTVERIYETLSDPVRLKARLEELMAELRAGAQSVDEQLGKIEIAYLEDFEFGDDPTLRKARRTLGLDPL